MSLTNIFMKSGTSEDHRAAVRNSVSRAMQEILNVPRGHQSLTIVEQNDDGLSFWRSYLGIEHSGEVLVIQITSNDRGGAEQKTALFSRILAHLSAIPGIDPNYVFMSLVQVGEEDWPFADVVPKRQGTG